jgi:hypothetical protein
VLTAAAGAAGALALNAVARPSTALAEGETVTVGGEFSTATSVTKITSTANIVIFEARNGSTGSTGVGIRVHSNNGTAFQASSSNLTPAVRADTTIYGFHNGAAANKFPVVARFEVHEQTGNFATALALQVIGKTEFTKSGVAVVLAGTKSVTVPVTQLTVGSFALATLQQIRAGVYVASVTHTVSPSNIVIHLNKNVTSDTKVGWLVSETPVTP